MYELLRLPQYRGGSQGVISMKGVRREFSLHVLLYNHEKESY